MTLYQALGRRSSRIAAMYFGAHAALRDGSNPERLCISAHEFRELIEKVPEIVDVSTPAQKERMGNKIQPVETAYDGAMSRSQVRPPGWVGTVDQPLVRLLESVREFFAWKKKHNVRRRQEVTSTLRALDGPGRLLPPDLEEATVSAWMEMKDFFQNVAHHQHDPTLQQFEEQVRKLESFLLAKLNPETFAEFDVLDAIIREGEHE